MTIDRKYRQPWTGKLPSRFLILSNELPRFGDASGAIGNRCVILQMTNSFLGQENTSLTSELITDLPGILNWSLEGLDRLTQQGRFTEPKSSIDAVLSLADLVSPVSAFVRDCCERDPAYEIPVAELYNAWRLWCEENGHRVTSVQTFGRDIKSVIPTLHTSRPRVGDSRERHFQGVRLSTQTHNGWARGPIGPEDPFRRPGDRFQSAGPHGPQADPLWAQVKGWATCDGCGQRFWSEGETICQHCETT